MTKNQRVENLKHNLNYLIEHIDDYTKPGPFDKMSPISAISVSSVKGQWSVHFGHDPVNEEIKIIKKSRGFKKTPVRKCQCK